MLSTHKTISEQQAERISRALTYCAGCTRPFTEDTRRPKQLHQCLHTVCAQCIRLCSKVKKTRFRKRSRVIFICPVCDQNIELDKDKPVRDNNFLIDLIRLLRFASTTPEGYTSAMASAEAVELRGSHLYPELRSVRFQEPNAPADNQENQPPPYFGSKAEEAAAAEKASAAAVDRPPEPPSFDSLYPDLSGTQRPAYDPSRTASAVPLPGMNPPTQPAARPPRVVINMVAKPQQYRPQQNQRPMAQRNVVFMNNGPQQQQQNRGSRNFHPVEQRNMQPSVSVMQPSFPMMQAGVPAIQIQTNTPPQLAQPVAVASTPVMSPQPVVIQTQTPPQTAPKPILKNVETPSPQLPVVPVRSSTPREEESSDNVPCQMKLLQSFGSYGEKVKPKVFQMATAVSVSDDGEIMVADPENMAVQAFGRGGEQRLQLKVVGLQAACRIQGDRVAVGTHRGLEVFDAKGDRLQSFQIGPVVAVVAFGSGLLAVQAKGLVGFMGAEELNETSAIRKRTKGSLLRTSVPFQQLTDALVNSKREIVVLDAGAGEMHVLGEDGHTRRTINPAGQPCGRLLNPRAITVDDQDNYYVCDTGNRRLLKFSPEGKFSRCMLNFTLGATAASPGDDASLTVYGACVHDDRITVTVNGSRRAQIRTYELP